jgi:hypothetical protein
LNKNNEDKTKNEDKNKNKSGKKDKAKNNNIFNDLLKKYMIENLKQNKIKMIIGVHLQKQKIEFNEKLKESEDKNNKLTKQIKKLRDKIVDYKFNNLNSYSNSAEKAKDKKEKKIDEKNKKENETEKNKTERSTSKDENNKKRKKSKKSKKKEKKEYEYIENEN